VIEVHTGADRAIRIPGVSGWRHVRAIVLLPGVATIAGPALILSGSGHPPITAASALVGCTVASVGVTLFIQTISLFARVGRGTLAPWDPTAKLVVEGPYRRVRNPMISGVLFVLVGEAIVFRSSALGIYAAIFFAVNALWMPLVEEPLLRERFGDDYERYAADVPRWLPRVRPRAQTLK
jgi:protein-S-isoprenylcysteine O-methyltransferase Ste14